MSQLNLLEQAKQGDPQAIAMILNKALQAKGVEATVGLEGDCLQVVLQSNQQLNVYRSSTLVLKAVQKLQPKGVYNLLVCGQLFEENIPAWSQTFSLGQAPTTLSAPPVESAAGATVTSEQPVPVAVASPDYPLRYEGDSQISTPRPDPDLVPVNAGLSPTTQAEIAQSVPVDRVSSEKSNSHTENGSTPAPVAKLPTSPRHAVPVNQTQPGAANPPVRMVSFWIGAICLLMGLGSVLWLPFLTKEVNNIQVGLGFSSVGLILLLGVPLLLGASNSEP